MISVRNFTKPQIHDRMQQEIARQEEAEILQLRRDALAGLQECDEAWANKIPPLQAKYNFAVTEVEDLLAKVDAANRKVEEAGFELRVAKSEINQARLKLQGYLSGELQDSRITTALNRLAVLMEETRSQSFELPPDSIQQSTELRRITAEAYVRANARIHWIQHIARPLLMNLAFQPDAGENLDAEIQAVMDALPGL